MSFIKTYLSFVLKLYLSYICHMQVLSQHILARVVRPRYR